VDRNTPWFAPIDLSWPYWEDYRQLILRLQGIVPDQPELPAVQHLQQVLSDRAVNESGRILHLVPSPAVPGFEYESRIFRSGQISTRDNNWHDLFNALVWARFPRLKAAINALHCRQAGGNGGGRRSRLSDGLTLLDECGVIVVSPDAHLLARVSARDWPSVFCDHAADWGGGELQIFVCGHALLEKFLKPYKSLTAHALLVSLDEPAADRSREDLLRLLDTQLAQKLLAGALFHSPAGLSPLPLMGIPGWWARKEQDEAFYADSQVFRGPPPGGFTPAPIFDLK